MSEDMRQGVTRQQYCNPTSYDEIPRYTRFKAMLCASATLAAGVAKRVWSSLFVRCFLSC